MQKATWSGQGEGTVSSPYILNVDLTFNLQQPFNILITTNYIDSQKEFNYFRFSNSATIYTLAYVVTNRDSLMYIEAKNAIKVTMFLTDKSNYLDGPYIVTSYSGTMYILKQQVFDPSKKVFEGFYRGLWQSKETYGVNDIVLFNNMLYVCLIGNSDSIFIHGNWLNLSNGTNIIQTRNPLPSDYNYDIGTIWINTVDYSHFILVDSTNNIAKWNLGSIRADEVTLSVNNNSELEIKNRTIEGGEW